MIRYSVIIPHYGTPELLERSVGSVPEREDTQVIVVDDLSPEGESLPERYPVLKRPGVVFLRSPRHGGAGAARNIGLKRAVGEWVLFMDADDFFVPGAFDVMDSVSDTDADIVFFRPRRVMSDHPDQPSARFAFLDDLYAAYEKGDEVPIRCDHWIPSSKMIRRSLIEGNGIRFEEIPYSNDVLFSSKAGCLARKIQVDPREVYCLCERANSLTDGYCRKPGERVCRLEALSRAHGLVNQFYRREHIHILTLMNDLFREDRKAFFRYFAQAGKYGVPRWRYAAKVFSIWGLDRFFSAFPALLPIFARTKR